MSTLTHSEEVLTHLDAPDRPFLNRTAPELVTLFLGLAGGLSRLHRGAVVDGVLVTPMRTGGVELLVGVSVDRGFGPVLAVGLGGVWVEVLADTSLRVLPVTTDDVKHMLGELRGARGTRPADLDALAQVVKSRNT